MNLVVLTGDAHSAWVHDLEADFERPGHPVATEFVGTSITSAFPPSLWPATVAAADSCPWTRYLDGQRRGYAIATVTRDAWRTDFRVVDSSPDQGQVTTPTQPFARVRCSWSSAARPARTAPEAGRGPASPSRGA